MTEIGLRKSYLFKKTASNTKSPLKEKGFYAFSKPKFNLNEV